MNYRLIRNPFNGLDIRIADLIWKGNPLSGDEVAFYTTILGWAITNVSTYEWNRLR